MKNKVIELLLVEDRGSDAELALIALQDHKLINNIQWVKNGQEAIDFLLGQGDFSDRIDATNPKLILLDLKMPKVDGLEVLKVIRSSKKTRNIPVVMMTTSREEQDRIEAYNLGVNSYIAKPVDFDKFTKSVQDLGFYWLLLNEPPE